MAHRSSLIPDLAGHTIDNGRLLITSTLGSGSNGVVFLAIDTTSSEENPLQYAVKCIIKPEKGSPRHDRQRLEISNHLKASYHPNVLTLHCVLEDCFFLYLVMDYCPRGDFFKFLLDGGIAYGDDDLVKGLFLQIIDAVDACHELGIFHRDIKPENILCSEDGTQVYLSDFGLSTRRPYSGTYGAGSSHYMSPECIERDDHTQAYSTRSNDVWALGVVLTAMISGHNPWRRATLDDKCYCAFINNQNFLLQTLPISPGVNLILRRIFCSDPSNRIELPILRLTVCQTHNFFAKREAGFIRSPIRTPGSSGSRANVLQWHGRGSRRSDNSHVAEESRERDNYDEHNEHVQQAPEIRAVPRSYPSDVSIWDTESFGPATPELYPQHALPLATEFPHKNLGAHDLANRKRSGSSSSIKFFRRVAEKLYLC
ncbi:uncharacterized protein FIBRA_08096 [Fibroporia radiculosa]|uniref:Protein kinase domain-containing protein n=1 Tax=Fibroporia radiculosa TaxID=599839 RepID=J4GW72_9APHY|nr:uncharacterized protein FIBRA_08096 [Fibroporia radiculosa]CCM05860.1 predicted protein [Fibroporia radiculosa]